MLRRDPRIQRLPRLCAAWVLIAALLGCTGSSEDTPGNESAGGERTRRPLVVLGIDGATWDLIDPMLERGELPNFQRLVQRGARADLVAILPLSSPAIWTTYATGRFARHHNVLDHTYPYVPGPKRRVRSTQRRVPALWNVASHYSRRVGVVGYFASHPPEKVNGVMLSDRSAKGAAGGFYPESLGPDFQPLLEQLQRREETERIRRRYLPWPYDASASRRPQDPYHRVTEMVKGRIAKHLVWEEFIRRAALRLAAQEFDLFMVYLRMIDHASHATWLYYDDSPFAEKADPFDKALLQDIIPTAYRDTDEYLGKLLAATGREVNIVIVSDHGFGPAVGPWAGKKPEGQSFLSGSHRPDGLFLAAGPDIRPGEIEGVNAMDVAPTLLALLDLPISSELPGRVERRLFRSDVLAGAAPRVAAPYRMRWQALAESDEPSDAAEAADLKILASLGYLDRDTPVAAGESGEALDFWQIEPRLSRNAIIGEAMFHLMRNDLASIEELIALAAEHDQTLADQLPRILRTRFQLWQASFDFPLLSEAARQAFEARFPLPAGRAAG